VGQWDWDMHIQNDLGTDNSRGEAKIGKQTEKHVLIFELAVA
jgi:hypothetical protein